MRQEYHSNAQQVALDHASGYGSRSIAGDGAFGVVYTDETLAYKMLRVRGSTAYLAYLGKVATSKLRAVPRVVDVVRYSGHEEFVVATLERLLPASTAFGYGLRDSFGSACKSICEAIGHGSFSNAWIVSQVRAELGWSCSMAADVVAACNIVMEAAYEVNKDNPLALLDLRGNNIMRRHTGELVITDPLAF